MTEQKALSLVLKSRDKSFLREANSAIVNRLKKLMTMECLDVISQLRIGDDVNVEGGRGGRSIKGKIAELRTKKVIVIEEGTGKRWKCLHH